MTLTARDHLVADCFTYNMQQRLVFVPQPRQATLEGSLVRQYMLCCFAMHAGTAVAVHPDFQYQQRQLLTRTTGSTWGTYRVKRSTARHGRAEDTTSSSAQFAGDACVGRSLTV